MRVLIVEDEVHTSALLKEIIELDRDCKVIQIISSISEAVSYLSKSQSEIDLCFLDIELSDGKSFEIFNHIDVTVPVVFCTAYDEYAMKAIKSNGIDYILKPIQDSDIHAALKKFKKWFSSNPSKLPDSVTFNSLKGGNYQKVFLTSFRDENFILKDDEVGAFYIKEGTVWIYTINGKKYPVFKNLEHFEKVCDPCTFFRINRKMIISRNAIQSYSPTLTRKLLLNLNVTLEDEVIVSRLKVPQFKEWLIKLD